MQRQRKTARTLLSIAAALVLVALFAACGGDSDDNSDSEPVATSTSAATETPSAASAGELEPGAHASDAFGLPVSFTVGDGWILGIDTPDFFAIDFLSPSEDDAPAGYITFLRPERTYNPTEMNLVLGPPPADFVAWFEGHRLLNIVRKEPATLGGLSGTLIEIDVDQGANFDLFETSDGAYGVDYRDHIVMYVLDAAGTQLLVSYGSDRVGNFPAFEALAQQVLATVSITPESETAGR